MIRYFFRFLEILCIFALLKPQKISFMKKLYLLLNLFTLPVLRTIEYCNKERLKIYIFRKFNVDRLRIVYHIAMVIVGCALYFCGIKESLFLTEISVVLFAYRCVGELLLKNKNISDIRKKNFDKVK